MYDKQHDPTTWTRVWHVLVHQCIFTASKVSCCESTDLLSRYEDVIKVNSRSLTNFDLQQHVLVDRLGKSYQQEGHQEACEKGTMQDTQQE